jgi:hypothetical protein
VYYSTGYEQRRNCILLKTPMWFVLSVTFVFTTLLACSGGLSSDARSTYQKGLDQRIESLCSVQHLVSEDPNHIQLRTKLHDIFEYALYQEKFDALSVKTPEKWVYISDAKTDLEHTIITQEEFDAIQAQPHLTAQDKNVLMRFLKEFDIKYSRAELYMLLELGALRDPKGMSSMTYISSEFEKAFGVSGPRLDGDCRNWDLAIPLRKNGM